MTDERPKQPEPRDKTSDLALGPGGGSPTAGVPDVSESLEGVAETTKQNDSDGTTKSVSSQGHRDRTGGRLRRYVRWVGAVAAVLVGVATVALVTIDLGPSVRARAEEFASDWLDREVRIGRIGAYIVPGRFLVEDLFIAGLEPEDRPFLNAGRIEVSIAWLALLHGEVLVDAEMSDWQMLAESFSDGRESFPTFVQRQAEVEDGAVVEPVASTDESGDAERRRLVATLRYLRANDGEFVLEDHGAGVTVTAPNLELIITKILDYRGHTSFSGGTVQIKDFKPIWADMTADFELDGAQVHLTRVDLETDGAITVLEGDVDLQNLPEMTYHLESDVDLARMRELFFADDEFTLSGDSHFSGTWHKFEGGHDLRGSFTSPVGGIEFSAGEFRFPGLDGQLRWQTDRLEVWDVVSTPYGGRTRFDFSIGKEPGQSIFDFGYEDLDVDQLGQLFDLGGIEPLTRVFGHNQLRWPTSRFSEFLSVGKIELAPPDGVRLATSVLPPGAAAAVEARAARPVDLSNRRFALGGGTEYTVKGDVIEFRSGQIATPTTHVTFDGRTQAGKDTRIPFQVASSDWQEGYRLMTAVMTAAGSPTDPFELDGSGTFEGVLLGDLSAPRVEATFSGGALRAWNVHWGAGRGRLVVDEGYIELANGMFERNGAEFGVDGLFSTSRSREDGGEEMNAVFTLSTFPSSNIQAAFDLDYTIDGPATGEVHLYGPYNGLFGFGHLTLDRPLAYGLSFDLATAGLRFEGNGVRLDGLEMLKGDGAVTGAAFIGWDAEYSFNWDARNIDVNTLEIIPTPPEPLSGTAQFNVSGVGAFDSPKYELRGNVVDLFVGDEEIGQVTGRLDVRDDRLTIDLEGASSTLAVSAAGQVGLMDRVVDLRVRVTNASLAPYVRMFDPRLSPYTSAVVSGSAHVTGELSWDRVRADATIEEADLTLLDYDVRNDGPTELSLDDRVISVDRLRLVGEGTGVDLAGSVDLATDALALTIRGDANLGILQGFVPDLRGSGVAEVRTRVSGTFSEPQLTGQATLSNGRIRHIALPHGIEAINGRIVFERDGLRFDDVPALMGGGAVTVGGRVGLNGFQPDELAVTLTGQEMQWRYPEGFRSLVDADLVLRGNATAPVLAGTINVRDAVLPDVLDMGIGLFGGSDANLEVTVSETEASGLPLTLDVRLVAPSSLRMTSNTVRIVSSAELTLQGSYDRPQLFGTAEIERGEAFFEGNRYRLNYGTISFANPNEIEPFINVEIETDIRVPGQTYRVTVRATGTVDRLVPALSSDPPLPEVDVLGLLLGDVRDPQGADLRAARAPELAQQQRLQAGAARLLTSSLSSGVGRVVEESFGVDTFQITPALGDPSSRQSAQLNPTARVLIGQRISGRAHLTLSRALSGANRDLIVVLEYDQSDRLAWVLSQNEDRTYALDFRVRHTF